MRRNGRGVQVNRTALQLKAALNTLQYIVALTGNIYSGLWYPVIIAAMTFVIGLFFVAETKDVDISA